MKSVSVLFLPILLLVACTSDRRGSTPPPTADGDAGTTTQPPDGDGGLPTMPTMPTRSGDCEGVPPEGLCDGDTLHYCDQGMIRTRDCTSIYPAPARGTCAVVESLGGAVCALSPGDPCIYSTTSGDSVTAPCAGPNAGCVWTESGSECRQNVGTCTGDRIICLGDSLMYGCLQPEGTVGQPTLIDCGDLGGSCSAPSCIGLPENAECAEPYLLCSEDLSCESSMCELDGPVTIRSCSGSTSSGACTNTADCAIIDGDPEGVFATGIGCLSSGDIGACVAEMTGLSRACSGCFATPEGSEFQSCAGF